MGNGMDKIIPGLFLGNFRDAKDVEKLAENNITHVVSIHDNAMPLLDHLKYKCVQAADSPDQELLPFFEQCIDFIHECRVNNGCCLVHCIAGVSRSTTIVAAYLMTITTLNWQDTLRAIRVNRAVANPNYGFKRQLQDFFNKHVQDVKLSLKSRYPDLDFNGADDAYLKSLLVKVDQSTENMSDEDDVANVVNMYKERNKVLRERTNNQQSTEENSSNDS
ncbi:dual specificity protein phosphatase 22-B [Exaiptasia diaphana]|uniref:Dual specificity protein phosphatase 15 n=1 Tax=Exaiptasia diaphana TaxID=2652724 RepID=A0A913WRE4_EXADI|nr:dual specificity protein phosphatase 22-B [Exaiptasia diaphana]KXJ18502.1 Dual specificity protein phosphatase 22 [Exaiptasia diaphana]